MTTVTKILNIEQAINLCQSPKAAHYNILPALLKLIATKLQMEGVILSVTSIPGYNFDDDLSVNHLAEMNIFEVLKGGDRKPIDVKNFQLKPVNFVEKEIDTFVKITKIQNLESSPFTQKEYNRDRDIMNAKIESIEKNIEKNSNLIFKALDQHEHIDKKVQMLTHQRGSTELNFTAETDTKHLCDCAKILRPMQTDFNRNFTDLAKNILTIGENLENVEDRVAKTEHLNNLFSQLTTKEALDSLNERVDSICHQISKFRKEVNCFKSLVDDIKDCAHYTDNRIQEIQMKLETLKIIRDHCERIEKLEHWKKYVHENFEKFTEITEFLKTTKADREEIDYLFEEKANRDELLKLVTLEFFKSVQDDLSSGVVQVLEQLMRNEIEWERAHKEIQLMMDVKADSCEVTSLKKYINCKLEIIQKKLNDLIRNKLTAHAAAVKIRLLKDARCITCTADADINQLKCPVPLLPPIQSFEVKCICEPRKRYCGGSHTVLGPDQKLINKRRMPLQSGTATTLNFKLSKGTNANFFRTRDEKCMCEKTPEQPEVKPEKKKLFPC